MTLVLGQRLPNQTFHVRKTCFPQMLAPSGGVQRMAWSMETTALGLVSNMGTVICLVWYEIPHAVPDWHPVRWCYTCQSLQKITRYWQRSCSCQQCSVPLPVCWLVRWLNHKNLGSSQKEDRGGLCNDMMISLYVQRSASCLGVDSCISFEMFLMAVGNYWTPEVRLTQNLYLQSNQAKSFSGFQALVVFVVLLE